MILGIGIDLIETKRFSDYASNNLLVQKILTPDEINYCLSSPEIAAQRIAARFAAKEAFLKALNAAFPEIALSLPNISKSVSVIKNGNIPYLSINWPQINQNLPTNLKAHLSLTHTKELANAIVLLEKS